KSDRQQKGPAEGQQQGHLGGVLGPGLPNKGESRPNTEDGRQVNEKIRKTHILACRGKNKLFLRKDLTEGCRKILRCWPRPSMVLNPYWRGSFGIWVPPG